jgi:glycerophosphoryl diester phosphodiesterase
LLKIGHKGADLIEPGNTLASFEAAVAAGAEMIELDVLRPRSDFERADGWRNAPAGPASAPGGGACEPLLVAHDWGDAARRGPLTLTETLDAFTRPPLDRVEIDFDLKVAGREDELVAALRERGLLERSGVSTMEVQSLAYLKRAEPGLPRGWTLPKTYRDWTGSRRLRPILIAGSAYMRARLPALVRARAPELGVWAVWVYHGLITARLVRAARESEIAVVAWTVDELERMRALRDLGVDGICTNDPRLFAELEAEG